MNVSIKQRPYWHVDLKWFCGILALAALGIALFTHALAIATERSVATDISTNVVASMFSKGGLDDSTDIVALRQKLAFLPGDSYAPFAEFPSITISKSDLMTKTPREIRLSLVRQITEPIYDNGLDAAAKQFSSNPDEQQAFKKQAGLLGLLTAKTHDTISGISMIAAGLAAIFLAGAVFFSAGWGRLVTPGVVMTLATPAGLTVSTVLLNMSTVKNSALAAAPSDVIKQIANEIHGAYAIVAVIGLSLLLVAFVGKMIMLFVNRPKKAQI